MQTTGQQAHTAPFDHQKHLTDLKGRPYMTVASRLVWFRHERPTWGIVSTAVEINLERNYAIFRAEIYDGAGKLVATGHAIETAKGFPDFVEKAETSSVGRALLVAGYGTQFALDELDEGERLADAPRHPAPRQQPQQNYGGRRN